MTHTRALLGACPPPCPCLTHSQGVHPGCAQGGFIVVNGVLASAHSDWLLDDLVPASWQPALPAIYQALFRPLFWVYRLRGPAAFAGFRPPSPPPSCWARRCGCCCRPCPWPCCWWRAWAAAL